MKTYRGFAIKADFGLGLQNHFERKNTQAPVKFSKWGGFKDTDWDFLDKEFYDDEKKVADGIDEEDEEKNVSTVVTENLQPSITYVLLK